MKDLPSLENQLSKEHAVSLSREARLLRLKKIFLEHFTEQRWKDLASAIDCSDLIVARNESLGAVTWGDDAYAATVLNTLIAIVDRNPADLVKLEQCADECLEQAREGSFTDVTLTRV